MNYRILESKTTPKGMETLYAAQAIKAAQDRAQAELARRAEETERQRQQKENQAEMELRAREREKQEAERKRATASIQLDSDLRASFFRANPSATESAFARLLPDLRDDHMRRKTVETFESLKAKKRAMYTSF